ncbi:hypothetical protein RCL1_007903 [Eukaryota sp. TZLM3-RCL]
MSTHPNAQEASICIDSQGLSTPPASLTPDTTHEGSARPAELPALQDPSLVPSVPAVPSATVGNVSVATVLPPTSTEDEEDLPAPIYSPVFNSSCSLKKLNFYFKKTLRILKFQIKIFTVGELNTIINCGDISTMIATTLCN